MLVLFDALILCFPQHLSEDIDDRALIQIEVVGALWIRLQQNDSLRI